MILPEVNTGLELFVVTPMGLGQYLSSLSSFDMFLGCASLFLSILYPSMLNCQSIAPAPGIRCISSISDAFIFIQ